MNQERYHIQFILEHIKHIENFTFEGREAFFEDL